MMFAQTRMDAPKNGASSREAHISVDIVAAPAMNTSGLSRRVRTGRAYSPVNETAVMNTRGLTPSIHARGGAGRARRRRGG